MNATEHQDHKLIHSRGLHFAGEESGDESGRLTNERWPRLVAGINCRIEYGKTCSLNKYINIVYCIHNLASAQLRRQKFQATRFQKVSWLRRKAF